jgi:hypothetical protein
VSNLFIDLKNKDFDPATLIDPVHISNLLEIVRSTNEPLEGNIFYEHHEKQFINFLPRFHKKRRAISIFGLTSSRMLEIGFNSGFSSLLMLTINNELHIHALDICNHNYTLPCFNYLNRVFGDRIKLTKGNSAFQLPLILNLNNYSSFHIDGGHGVDIAELDLVNIIAKAKDGSIICFDDTDEFYSELKIMLLKYVLNGQIIDVGNGFQDIDNNLHMFFRVCK